MKRQMKQKWIAAALASAACGLLPFASHAAPSKKTAATTAPAPMQYRAQCGMVYSAAEAKKDHYICPMDGKQMTAIKPSAGTVPKKVKS
jgi:hypothetical protein